MTTKMVLSSPNATAYAVAVANNRRGPWGKPVFERCLQLFLNVYKKTSLFFCFFKAMVSNVSANWNSPSGNTVQRVSVSRSVQLRSRFSPRVVRHVYLYLGLFLTSCSCCCCFSDDQSEKERIANNFQVYIEKSLAMQSHFHAFL